EALLLERPSHELVQRAARNTLERTGAGVGIDQSRNPRIDGPRRGDFHRGEKPDGADDEIQHVSRCVCLYCLSVVVAAGRAIQAELRRREDLLGVIVTLSLVLRTAPGPTGGDVTVVAP